MLNILSIKLLNKLHGFFVSLIVVNVADRLYFVTLINSHGVELGSLFEGSRCMPHDTLVLHRIILLINQSPCGRVMLAEVSVSQLVHLVIEVLIVLTPHLILLCTKF